MNDNIWILIIVAGVVLIIGIGFLVLKDKISSVSIKGGTHGVEVDMKSPQPLRTSVSGNFIKGDNNAIQAENGAQTDNNQVEGNSNRISGN